ncbi:thiamine/thiamine pyrophosphate ABC transporter permease ThiP [Xinfangfangia sp. D13-10-4-6]|uniref:thiamine/thiamine pyrophosphate ABC transporter permease ThiP n=1 Tax=Pseudogemmobacter hezensis TaxID=2737662 RepID=UPI001555AC83|nr:thiamine/thiamine pyrophosphate ABC transporter permease ThiP [Pseudogemmobacter hezensis]NPD14280.1 thiamine/thiamine pyrophosphate ABC transporter permease ThiP [Pseudogemmobacter hezensis]
MASRPRSLGAGAISAGLLALILGPIAAVAFHAGGLSLGAADLAALRFTLLQASLSALISAALAVPVAKALARRRFPGRGLLITLMGAPFLLPVIVAVMGLITVFGQAGWINSLGQSLGLPRISIYGLHGVLIAHVFLNLPLAVRMILQGWLSIPAERFRLGQSLGFTPRDIARHIERPMLAQLLPGVLASIFAICLTSFAVALTLGGGPAATTLELAIYQAIRFEFDLAHAAGLALLQTGLGAVAALLAWQLAGMRAGPGAGLDRPSALMPPTGWRRIADGFWLIFAAAFLLLPLTAMALKGLPGLTALPASVWPAALRSVTVALISAFLTVTLGMILVGAVARGGARWIEFSAVLPLAASGMVLGIGLFLLVRPWIGPAQLALPVTLLVNVLMALPFVYRLLITPARNLEADYGRLAASLGLVGFARIRLLTWPRMAAPIGFSAGLSAALSMGDLGVIALFAAPDQVTLPLLVQHLLGAYRIQAAAGAALVLVALSFALFWLLDAGGRYVQAR